MDKTDIINALGRRFGARRYLEICTPTTGMLFAGVSRETFAVCDRLMYRCPADFDDGMAVTFRTSEDVSVGVVDQILDASPEPPKYDLVLVDPFHTELCSRLDLLGAACLVEPDGIIVVHDCNPTDVDLVAPTYQPGAWCGVTYAAFIDLAMLSRWSGYFTVDCDYGCGVLFGHGAEVPDRARHYRVADRLALRWNHAKAGDDSRFRFFEENRAELLNLASFQQFEAALLDVGLGGRDRGTGHRAALDRPRDPCDLAGRRPA